MFDHRNLAVEGLFPGLVTTQSVANLGLFDIEVIIQPIPVGGGGGYAPTLKPDKYQVTIRVTMKNGRRWTYTRVVSNTLARVFARLARINLETDPTKVTVHSVTLKHPTTDIKAYKK